MLPWVLLIFASMGMVGWIWRGERGSAKPGYPLVAGHHTAILLSSNVYGIQGVIRRYLSIEDGSSTVQPTLLRGLFQRIHDG